MNVEIVEAVKSDKKSVDLTEAKLIVSGGRGVGSAEGFDVIRDMADALGAEVGSSRACVDAGWIEKDRQVGQTGKTVRPTCTWHVVFPVLSSTLQVWKTPN